MQSFVLLLSFVLCVSSKAFEYLPYKTISGPYEMEFPIFANENNTKAINKINTHLQMMELMQIATTRNREIFNTICPAENDFGKVGMNVAIKENTERILSIRFDQEYSWLTIDYWSRLYGRRTIKLALPMNEGKLLFNPNLIAPVIFKIERPA